jgi:hypothetical protein
MPICSALHGAGVDARARSKFARLSTCVLIVFCAGALAGCDYTKRDLKLSTTGVAGGTGSRTPIPLPGRGLLQAQPEPQCAFESTEPKTDERQKLDYERQCYRHAEMIARGRLDLLQGSVAKTIKAVKRSERRDL